MSAGAISAQQTLRAVLERCAAFFHWWGTELHDLWLDLLERFAPGKSARTTIKLTRTGGRIIQELRSRDSESIWFQREADGGLPISIQAFWPSTAARGMRTRVELPESSVLYCELTLPAAAERELSRVIDLQLERVLPVTRDQVYVDWRITSRNTQDSKIVVAAAAVRCAEVNNIRDTLKVWDFPAMSIGITDTAANNFEFLPRMLSRRLIALTPIDRYLGCSAVVLLLMCALTVGGQWWYERFKVTPELNAAHAAAAATERSRQALLHQIQPIATLRRLMQRPSTAEILAGITRSCPADTWIQNLKIQSRDGKPIEIKLTAITPTATTLLDQLRKLPQLREVKMLSAVSAGIGTAKDRAEITAQWSSIAVPQAKAGGPP